MATASGQAAPAEVVELLDSGGEEEAGAAPARRASGRRPARPQQGGPRQQQQPQANRRRRAEGGGGGDLIDLTGDSPPTSPRVEVVSSTVAPAQQLKRPRLAAPKASLMQQLVQQARNPPPPPPVPSSPKALKCGICLEAMGSSTNRPMASGPCGHVYCRDCLTEAVRAQKKCPSCRRTLQIRQLHQVFVELTH